MGRAARFWFGFEERAEHSVVVKKSDVFRPSCFSFRADLSNDNKSFKQNYRLIHYNTRI